MLNEVKFGQQLLENIFISRIHEQNSSYQTQIQVWNAKFHLYFFLGKFLITYIIIVWI